MKNHYIILFISVVILVAGFLFYWYEYRPNNIRKECSSEGLSGLELLANKYQIFNKDRYESCLHRNGL